MSEKIIVIDDDEHICDLVRIALEAEGFSVDAAFDGEDGINKMGLPVRSDKLSGRVNKI